MKKHILPIVLLFLTLGNSAIASSLTYSAEVRKMSYADDRLFHDMLFAPGGVGFADEAFHPDPGKGALSISR